MIRKRAFDEPADLLRAASDLRQQMNPIADAIAALLDAQFESASALAIITALATTLVHVVAIEAEGDQDAAAAFLDDVKVTLDGLLPVKMREASLFAAAVAAGVVSIDIGPIKES